jgi:hypothetical protein
MTSYDFDSFQTDTNYLTLYKSTCCGITYGIPRKHVIHRDMINFITYGRYFNGFLAVFSILMFILGFILNEEALYFASGSVFFYTVSKYITSNMVICCGNVYFTSSCCTNHENLIDWYRQQELVHANTPSYTHVV